MKIRFVIIAFLICRNAIAYADSVAESSLKLSNNNIESSKFSCGFGDVVEKSLSSVVTITTHKLVEDKFDKWIGALSGPFLFKDLRGFIEHLQPELENESPSKHKVSNVATGFYIGDGYILTSHHVVNEMDEIIIGYQDRTEEAATIVGVDPLNDIALLKVSRDSGMIPLKFGNSDDIRVGDSVVALGNPFGVGISASSGIISAKSRNFNLAMFLPHVEFLQTDAVINFGNSGGPLVNSCSEVVGIISAIIHKGKCGVNPGVGFAVPSNAIAPIIEVLKKDGKIVRGYVGIVMRNVSADMASALNLPKPYGAMIVKVLKDSPAEKAGLLPGDVITQFGEFEAKSDRSVMRAVANSKVNEFSPVTIMRMGKEMVLSVQILQEEKDDTAKKGGQKKDSSQEKSTKEKDIGMKTLGIQVENITQDLKQYFGIANDANGILIVSVTKGGVGEINGLMAGDVIQQVNQQNVKNKKEFLSILNAENKNNKKKILLLIERSGIPIVITAPFIVANK